MSIRSLSLTALCLLVAGCDGMSMSNPLGASSVGGTSGGSSPTSYESGYGVGSGSSGETNDGRRMTWGE